MVHAMELAGKCWKRACEVEPDWVSLYLDTCADYLEKNLVVPGDMFRHTCWERGVILPKTLHHNTWVCGPRIMEKLDWIVELPWKEEPTSWLNHMSDVSVWYSRLYPIKGKK